MSIISYWNKLSRNLRRLRYLDTNIALVKDLYKKTFNFTYRGIPTVKFPKDLATYQMLLNELRPDLIIEIGTHLGGSALYLADLLSIMEIDGVVHTIDIRSTELDDQVKHHSKIRIFTDGYSQYDLTLTDGHKTVLVIDDGSHERDDVLGAFAKFAPAVCKDSYYIVEDAIVTHLGIQSELKLNGGPFSAIQTILETSPCFKSDDNLSNFWGKGLTANHRGYLKRVC